MLELWNESLPYIIRILTAAALGGLLGLERDIHGREAGLRTHLLVCAGSALFMTLSTTVSSFGVLKPEAFQGVTDPGRIAAQIVTGIGFLGAGAIIKDGLSVRGLTTAACLWITCAIGMSAGAGLYILAVTTTCIALFSLSTLNIVEKTYKKDVYRNLTLSLPLGEKPEHAVAIMKQKGLKIISTELLKDYDAGIINLTLGLQLSSRGNVDNRSYDIIAALEESQIPLKSVKWYKI
ncbi:MgtC/SapB family protein [Desulfoluna sp.]|uniref:MgtC/SapB family protein n=1 Tax=Desulfoluna sp. TaxID=2045199 RepID=UPI002630EFEC|nr:MgtC/SapB family protein [Desulfoluna sp.]